MNTAACPTAPVAADTATETLRDVAFVLAMARKVAADIRTGPKPEVKRSKAARPFEGTPVATRIALATAA